jgi:hypothetical protein
MNRREVMLAGLALGITPASCYPQAQQRAIALKPGSRANPGSPPTILLDGYLPQSLYRIPVSKIDRAKYPVVDVHCHGHLPLSVPEMIKIMDAVGIEKTIIFTGAATHERFVEAVRDYAGHPNRFEFWCLFDLKDIDNPGFGPNAVKSLEACHRAGARGVGELVDKGRGFATRPFTEDPEAVAQFFANLNDGPTFTRPPEPPSSKAYTGPHPDDPRLDVLWNRISELGMPASVHVSDPIWSYQPMDYTNDGLMNGWTWKITMEPGMYDHNQLVNSLERTVRKHPKTTFIACHLSNLDYDLARLGEMFDRNSNLYADIAARFAETATIPRFVRQFLLKYSDRIVYGSDVPYNKPFFSTTFRILETADEHFYMRGNVESANFNFNYHWALNGFDLPENVLKKIYCDNIAAIMARAQRNSI